jgi:putative flavoprotein involved in K+ transport
MSHLPETAFATARSLTLIRGDALLPVEAENVVIATGLFQSPKIPPFSASMPSDVLQIHSLEYRNPSALPPGAALVVGTGQSGAQIAEELYQSGRKVYLSIRSAGRVPR